MIDTPGFDDTLKTDAEILDIVCEFLLTEFVNIAVLVLLSHNHRWQTEYCRYKHEQFLNGVIYLHRISDNRMSGSALRNFRFFEQLCGPDAIKNCAIVTNMWNMVERDIAESREHELFARDDFFKRAIDGGAKKFRHLDNTKESAHSVIKPLLANKPVPLRIQTELSDPKTSIANTTAGAALLGELAELTRKHEEEMRELEADLEEAKRENDLQATRELEEAKAALAKAKQKLEEETKKILASDAPVEQEDKLLKRLVRSGRTALNFVSVGRLRPTKYVQNLNPFKENKEGQRVCISSALPFAG